MRLAANADVLGYTPKCGMKTTKSKIFDKIFSLYFGPDDTIPDPELWKSKITVPYCINTSIILTC